jgi:hypothetical protein
MSIILDRLCIVDGLRPRHIELLVPIIQALDCVGMGLG